MKITWIGQAGIMMETEDTCILVDPYLSDSCGKKNPKSARRIPVDEALLKVRPQILLITHDHLDHLDPETLEHYLSSEEKILVLAGANAWEKLRAMGGNHNYVRMTPGCEWSVGSLRITAVSACHSDVTAVGFLIQEGNKQYYVTGDTLYDQTIFAQIPRNVEAVFLPINGVGNNMNAKDATRFAQRIGAKYSVPLHFGLFDDLDPSSFEAKNRIIPKIYEEIILP